MYRATYLHKVYFWHEILAGYMQMLHILTVRILAYHVAYPSYPGVDGLRYIRML